jgi:nucleotide-binding universal stress UspA family protein
MTYATVMVSLVHDRPCEACLAVAGDLAERFEAHAIGITAAEFSPPLYYTSGSAAQALIDKGYAAIDKNIAELESLFRSSLQGRARTMEWRSAREMPAKYIAAQARAADIVIVDGHADALADPFARANPNDLVMQLGRPLLLVPPEVRWLDLRSVLVAWKDRPEARRAIADALPLLRKAKDVAVAQIAEGGDSIETASARAKDVVAWLSRHGIFASELVAGAGGDVPAQLDAMASDVGAGLVVAGAYGHSRFREWVLGGVTRHLMARSTRCVLLSR